MDSSSCTESFQEPRVIQSLKNRIKSDIERFATLHLWYKELSYKGKQFIIFPWKGVQPQNYLITPKETSDYTWHIWEASRVDEIPITGRGKVLIIRNTITFNCLLYGCQKDQIGNSFIPGWVRLVDKYPSLHQLKEKYGVKSYIDGVLKEKHLQIADAINAAHEILTGLSLYDPEWLGLPPKFSPARSDSEIQTYKTSDRKVKLTQSTDGTFSKTFPASPRPKTSKNAIRRLTKKLSKRDLSRRSKES